MALLRLHSYTGERVIGRAERALRLFREFIEKQPFGFSHMLEAVDLYQRGRPRLCWSRRQVGETLEWVERSVFSTCQSGSFVPIRREGTGFVRSSAR